MSSDDRISPGIDHKTRVVVEDFRAYCDVERERRFNSDEELDTDLFDRAVNLVLDRLKAAVRKDDR